MSDYIVVDGDLANFLPVKAPAVVVPRPGKFQSSLNVKVGGKSVCVDGDEAKVKVAGVSYNQGAFVGGTGTLLIQSMAPDQKTRTVRCFGKPLLLKGQQYVAKLQVNAPAQQPSPSGPIPDPTPFYNSMDPIIVQNLFVKAS